MNVFDSMQLRLRSQTAASTGEVDAATAASLNLSASVVASSVIARHSKLRVTLSVARLSN